MSILSTTSNSERFADFIKDCVGHIGTLTGSGEKWLVSKIKEGAIGAPLAGNFESMTRNADKIAQIFFVIGCFYNFYTSPTLYVGGFVLGTLASASSFPADFPSLKNVEVLGRTADEYYAGQKTMFALAALNYYLGRTMIDDMFFSILAGLLSGNSFYHEVKKTKAASVIPLIGDKLAGVTALFYNKLPFAGMA